jgi:large subunit ribosomal protein L29
MKPEDIRDHSESELDQLEEQLKEELFTLRMQQATGQLQNTAALSEKRRDIARVKTIRTEKQLEQ